MDAPIHRKSPSGSIGMSDSRNLATAYCNPIAKRQAWRLRVEARGCKIEIAENLPELCERDSKEMKYAGIGSRETPEEYLKLLGP